MCWTADLLNVCTEAYPCLSKVNVSLKLRKGGGGDLAGCHVVARKLGYHLVCSWKSLVKFQGSGVVFMFDFFFPIHRRLSPRFFLEDGGRQYTCYHVHRFINSRSFTDVQCIIGFLEKVYL